MALADAEQEELNRANLSAFWGNAVLLGHIRLIFVGVFLDANANRACVKTAIPGASITRVVLETSDEELERRIRVREIGPAPTTSCYGPLLRLADFVGGMLGLQTF